MKNRGNYDCANQAIKVKLMSTYDVGANSEYIILNIQNNSYGNKVVYDEYGFFIPKGIEIFNDIDHVKVSNYVIVNHKDKRKLLSDLNDLQQHVQLFDNVHKSERIKFKQDLMTLSQLLDNMHKLEKNKFEKKLMTLRKYFHKQQEQKNKKNNDNIKVKKIKLTNKHITGRDFK